MPNWVTNKVKASREVIESIINAEGNIDFNNIISFEGEFPWDGVISDAEMMAEIVVKKPLSDHPLIRGLEASNRERASVEKLSDESFEQFIQMLRNYRKCGFLHSMDFARECWGTKWNACDSVVHLDEGTASFDTAWSCPEPIFETLSKKFPDETIEVQFADEDIGCNCGSFVLKGGEYISVNIAPKWDEQTDEQKAQWKSFAYEVKGRTPPEDDEREE